MAISSTIFWLDVLTLAFVVLSLAFLVRNREYEKSAFENSLNALLFGLLLMVLVKVIDVLYWSREVYPDFFASTGLETYIDTMLTVSQVALLPLFAVCVLVAVIFAKDAFESVS